MDFLQFTEQPRTIWATNNAAEALRLMAYWTSYTGFGFRGTTVPFFTESATLLFNPLVVGASLLVPALAILGFTWTRRWRYGPFFLLLLLVGMVVEVAGFPDGHAGPARDGVDLPQRLRAELHADDAEGRAARRHGDRRAARARRPARLRPPARLSPAGADRCAGRGRRRPGAPDRPGRPAARARDGHRAPATWDHIPAAWTQAGKDLDRTLAPNTRAMVLPGQIFGYYDWGGTVDAILPRLTRRPVAVRYETPYSDPHATDLLVTTDRLVQQERLYPGSSCRSCG